MSVTHGTDGDRLWGSAYDLQRVEKESTHPKDSVESLQERPRETSTRSGIRRIDNCEIERSTSQMDQATNERERGDWQKKRFDSEDVFRRTRARLGSATSGALRREGY